MTFIPYVYYIYSSASVLLCITGLNDLRCSVEATRTCDIDTIMMLVQSHIHMEWYVVGTDYYHAKQCTHDIIWNLAGWLKKHLLIEISINFLSLNAAWWFQHSAKLQCGYETRNYEQNSSISVYMRFFAILTRNTDLYSSWFTFQRWIIKRMKTVERCWSIHMSSYILVYSRVDQSNIITTDDVTGDIGRDLPNNMRTESLNMNWWWRRCCIWKYEASTNRYRAFSLILV